MCIASACAPCSTRSLEVRQPLPPEPGDGGGQPAARVHEHVGRVPGDEGIGPHQGEHRVRRLVALHRVAEQRLGGPEEREEAETVPVVLVFVGTINLILGVASRGYLTLERPSLATPRPAM
jgi:hypothetical protein